MNWHYYCCSRRVHTPGQTDMFRITQTTLWLAFICMSTTAGCSGTASGGAGTELTGGTSGTQGGSTATSRASGGENTGGVTTGAVGGTATGVECGVVAGDICCSSTAPHRCGTGLVCQGASATATGTCQSCGNAYAYQPCCDTSEPGGSCRSGICIGGRCNPDYAVTAGRSSTSPGSPSISAAGGYNAGS
jgi:hypothetical protein